MVAYDLVEGAEGLVHQQQLRIEGEGAGDRGALLHSAGELPGKFVLEARQVHEVQLLIGALAPLRLRETEDFERQLHVLADRPPGIEGRGLEDEAVFAPEPAPRRG